MEGELIDPWWSAENDYQQRLFDKHKDEVVHELVANKNGITIPYLKKKFKIPHKEMGFVKFEHFLFHLDTLLEVREVKGKPGTNYLFIGQVPKKFVAHRSMIISDKPKSCTSEDTIAATQAVHNSAIIAHCLPKEVLEAIDKEAMEFHEEEVKVTTMKKPRLPDPTMYPNFGFFYTRILDIDSKGFVYLDPQTSEDNFGKRKLLEKALSIFYQGKIEAGEINPVREVVDKTVYITRDPKDPTHFCRSMKKGTLPDNLFQMIDVDTRTCYGVTYKNIFPISAIHMEKPFFALKCSLNFLDVFYGSDAIAVAVKALGFTFPLGGGARYRGMSVVTKQPMYHFMIHKENVECLEDLIYEKIHGDIAGSMIGNGRFKMIWIEDNKVTFQSLEYLDEISEFLMKEVWVKKLHDNPQGMISKDDLEMEVVYVARWSSDGMFYRINAKGITKDLKVSVKFIDFGNTDFVNLDQIIPVDDINPLLGKLPKLSFDAELDGCRITDSDKLLEYIQENECDFCSVEFNKDKTVDVMIEKTQQSLADLAKKKKWAK